MSYEEQIRTLDDLQRRAESLMWRSQLATLRHTFEVAVARGIFDDEEIEGWEGTIRRLEAKATPEFTADEIRHAYESVRWPIDPTPGDVVE